MSLKTVHMFFIIASILVSFLFAGWSWRRAQETGAVSDAAWAASAAALGACLVVYLAFFIRKTRRI